MYNSPSRNKKRALSSARGRNASAAADKDDGGVYWNAGAVVIARQLQDLDGAFLNTGKSVERKGG